VPQKKLAVETDFNRTVERVRIILRCYSVMRRNFRFTQETLSNDDDHSLSTPNLVGGWPGDSALWYGAQGSQLYVRYGDCIVTAFWCYLFAWYRPT